MPANPRTFRHSSREERFWQDAFLAACTSGLGNKAPCPDESCARFADLAVGQLCERRFPDPPRASLHELGKQYGDFATDKLEDTDAPKQNPRADALSELFHARLYLNAAMGPMLVEGDQKTREAGERYIQGANAAIIRAEAIIRGGEPRIAASLETEGLRPDEFRDVLTGLFESCLYLRTVVPTLLSGDVDQETRRDTERDAQLFMQRSAEAIAKAEPIVRGLKGGKHRQSAKQADEDVTTPRVEPATVFLQSDSVESLTELLEACMYLREGLKSRPAFSGQQQFLQRANAAITRAEPVIRGLQ